MIRVMERLAKNILAMGVEIRYSTSVIACQQSRPGSWQISSAPNDHPIDTTSEDFDKLVISTGTFSLPSVPSYVETYMHPRRSPVKDLQGPLTIHTSHLSESTVQEALYSRQRRIAIIGGSKSALDAAERLAMVSYAFRKAPSIFQLTRIA